MHGLELRTFGSDYTFRDSLYVRITGPDSDWLLKQVYENYIESDWETSHGGLGVLCVV